MSDLISRQAAIDVLNKLADIKYTHMPYYGYYLGALHDAANDIKALPSVQPEIIRCKDCKYGSPNGKYGCKCYHYRLYETHEMKQEDFCSHAERRTDETD